MGYIDGPGTPDNHCSCDGQEGDFWCGRWDHLEAGVRRVAREEVARRIDPQGNTMREWPAPTYAELGKARNSDIKIDSRNKATLAGIEWDIDANLPMYTRDWLNPADTPQLVIIGKVTRSRTDIDNVLGFHLTNAQWEIFTRMWIPVGGVERSQAPASPDI